MMGIAARFFKTPGLKTFENRDLTVLLLHVINSVFYIVHVRNLILQNNAR